jgi:LacI family repressor for deo operon, udp, cdd, tsx, nupC, and nupG
MAISVIGALAHQGIRVPDDIVVTGWDDINIASLITPALTTVHQPTRDLGAGAARMLLSLISNEPIETADTVLPSRLKIRESCGCRSGPAPGAREDDDLTHA